MLQIVSEFTFNGGNGGNFKQVIKRNTDSDASAKREENLSASRA